MTAEPQARDKKKRRTLPREVRREQLINATMKCIAEHGLSGVTLARVTSEADLSLGIANLHFDSKEKLLLATLEQVTTEYSQGHDDILTDDSYTSISDKLDALLAFDFSARVMTRPKLAVWFAFLGEATTRPIYQKVYSSQDRKAQELLATLFRLAVDEGGYPIDPGILASGYTSLVDGLWLNVLLSPRKLNRKKAKTVARQFLAAALPGHVRRAG